MGGFLGIVAFPVIVLAPVVAVLPVHNVRVHNAFHLVMYVLSELLYAFFCSSVLAVAISILYL